MVVTQEGIKASIGWVVTLILGVTVSVLDILAIF